jgi:HAE1 family hydrophobic/amphiphilic exporter-1
MSLTRFAITRPVITAMFFIALAIYGAMSYTTLGVNLFPNVSFPIVAVSASYPGASPAEMEKLVIKPIEDQLDGIENLDRLNAVAQEGTATVIVRFRLDTDINYETIDVQRRVDTARVYMPTDLDPPVVFKFSAASDPIIEEALSSKRLTQAQLSDLVTDRLIPDIKTVPGVQDVDTSGGTAREFHVYPDFNQLLATGATLADLNSTIGANNANLPGGRVDSPTQETTVSVHADIVQPQDLLLLPVSVPGGAQSTLKIGDIARVDDGHVEQRRPTRFNGAASVLLDIQRQVDADTLKTTEATRKKIDQLRKTYPDIEFAEIDASADYTRASVNGVLQSLIEGIFLTAIVMLLFLHAWRNAVVVMIAIPTSLLATFIVMRLMGFTVDLISMMGLGLTIGILVDDSIVVLENITRHRDMGEAPMDAAYNGRTEIGNAAIAITLVDVVVFLPIAFLSGIVGKYMKEFGVVIVVATLFSLLVSFTLTPLLAGRWSVKRRSEGPPWWARGFQNVFDALGHWYAGKALPVILSHRIKTAAICGLLVVGAFALVPLGFIGSEFIPSSDTGVVSGTITYSVGTPLATTVRGLERLEGQLLKIDGVASVLTTGGSKPSGFSSTTGGHVARFTIVLDKNRRKETDRVASDARKLAWTVPGAEYDLAKEGGGGSGASISFRLTGPDAELRDGAEKLAAFIRQQPGAVNVQTGAENEGPRLNIRIDPVRAAVVGVAPGQAALSARIAIGGLVSTKVRMPDGLIDVRLELPENQRNDLALLRRLQVRASNGMLIPLSQIADFTMMTAPTKIERQARERIVTVTGSVDASSHVSLGEILKPVYAKIAQPGFLPDGVHAVADGDSDLFNQTFASMGLALITSFALVYMLMVVLYGSFLEPFVVMFSVPVSIVGALGGLAIRHQTLNLFSMIAIIMLFGLVAKNGILLVDYANQMHRRGLGVVDSMKAAAGIRFRPILMTTCAMIFGMLPLSLGLTEGAEERASMGTVLIGGLLSSLILTLALVPVVYTWIMGGVAARENRRATKRANEEEHDVPGYDPVPFPSGAAGE